jgi:hypothetical protein
MSSLGRVSERCDTRTQLVVVVVVDKPKVVLATTTSQPSWSCAPAKLCCAPAIATVAAAMAVLLFADYEADIVRKLCPRDQVASAGSHIW